MPEPLNVIFMGTPDFAVPSLNALNDYGCAVPMVVTRTDRPKGRGQKMLPPPVKVAATKLDFTVFQPETVNTDKFYKKILQIHPDLLVVVAFGHIIPKKILEIPIYGAINIHASLLPKYRGPAPIQRAIINGEAETGVTTMLMDKGLDTGEILLTSTVSIHPDDTAETLHDRLADVGANLLKKTLTRIENKTLKPIPQEHARATYAPMLKKKDGHIDWTLSANQIERFVRGMTPWPGAYTFYGNKRLKIFKAALKSTINAEPPGTVTKGFSNELRVATGDGVLSILEIQGSSGKRLVVSDFLRGNSIPVGTVLT